MWEWDACEFAPARRAEESRVLTACASIEAHRISAGGFAIHTGPASLPASVMSLHQCGGSLQVLRVRRDGGGSPRSACTRGDAFCVGLVACMLEKCFRVMDMFNSRLLSTARVEG